MTELDPNVLVAAAIAAGPTIALAVNAFFTFLNNRLLKGIKEVGEKTHDIINGQGTRMVQAIATLSQRVARDNPNDRSAQEASQEANNENVERIAVNTNARRKAEERAR